LRSGIAEQLIFRVRHRGCDLDVAQIHDLLSVDIDLNAQGLEVWLMRRAKKTAESAGS